MPVFSQVNMILFHYHFEFQNRTIFLYFNHIKQEKGSNDYFFSIKKDSF